MHKLRILFLIFIGSIFFDSCSIKQTNADILLQADSLMGSRPDSVFNMLKNISQSELYSNSDYALYALLFTKASDKNYIEHSSDSLISIAVSFYHHSSDNNRKAEAFLYLGKVYQDMNDDPEAIEAYLKALEAAPDDMRLMTLIYDNLAACYKSQRLYNKSKEMFYKSYDINSKKDKESLYSIRGIASVYALQDSTQMALSYYLKALSMLQNTNDSTWKSTILCDIARIYETIGMHKEAETYINQSIRYMPVNYNASAINFWKGEILYGLHKYDSANYYLKIASQDSDLYTQAAIYQTLYRLHAETGNYKQAILYNDTALTLSDSLQSLVHHFEIENIQRKHSIRLYKQEVASKHKQKIFVLIICSLLGLLFIVSLVIYLNRRNNKTKISLELELFKSQAEKSMLKRKQRQLTQTVEENGILNAKMQYKQILLWEQVIKVCARLFQKTTSYQKLIVIEATKIKVEKRLSQEEVAYILNDISETFRESIQILNEMYPRLTQDDLLYCALSYLKIPINNIGICMQIGSTQALTQRKHRIKKQMNAAVFDIIFDSKTA